MSEAPILEVNDLSMVFGGLRAVDNVSLNIKKGEIVALIGPNGAGKTTFFNCVTGVYVPTHGEIKVNIPNGKSSILNGLKPNVINGKGLARTFQNIRLFSNMSVLENVMIGRHQSLKSGILSSVIRTKKNRIEETQVIDDCYEILKKIGLEMFVNEIAKNLPYGAQRRLEIARAMATNPFLLLLDEPAAGMNPQETKDLVHLIKKLRTDEDISILLIEHDMSLVMSLSERIYVVDYGKMIAEGTPQEIKNNREVIKAYLGEDIDA
ncbi:ABC transporter ATP-binding protein [Oceanispirochaeta sp.]|jgi:branched-chain amino acid transport system ATP-binding protein|uniref:ABC transporter ATP-binding protein n=1 Tax=Oceanispirochaeta sp. TaxID=2035350 RepID=UPI002624428D|nr:ABC transporter ATP-binding protein [Oceanispirochaeta sp.]MDA3958110.1 ABC transporter ATP-binding protein [Oceanispirochaeta sp.]